MKKTMNIICLVVWSIALILGIIGAIIGTEISPVSYICAVLICVMHYIEELIDKKENE